MIKPPVQWFDELLAFILEGLGRLERGYEGHDLPTDSAESLKNKIEILEKRITYLEKKASQN